MRWIRRLLWLTIVFLLLAGVDFANDKQTGGFIELGLSVLAIGMALNLLYLQKKGERE